MQNVVFIVTDSLRKDKLGVYNDDVDFTDNIDDFSNEATVFEDVVAQSCWTLPSHASMFTALYPWEHGATQKNLNLDVEQDLLVERFSDEGFDTACFSMNGFLKNHSGLTEGFDTVENLAFEGSSILQRIIDKGESWMTESESKLRRIAMRIGDKLFHYFNSEMRETEEILDKAEDFVENSDDFFVLVNLMDAHEPYHPPEEYLNKHDAKGSICQDATDFYSGRKNADFEEIHRHYDASVDYMDDQIGEFFTFLMENDLWDETVIVLVSDHGQMLGENDHYGHQYSVHEDLVSVPMIVKGAEKGKVSEQVELREIYELLPYWAGISEKTDLGTEYAKGWYEFPDMMRNRIPKGKYDRLYSKHSFIRTQDTKAVKTEDEDEEIDYKCIDLNDESKGELDDEVRNKLDKISSGDSETGEDFDDKEEEIKEQLEALGYG